MVVRVAINGFGRIGRLFYRQAMKEKSIEIVAVNDLTDAKTLAHLLKFDSVHGILDAKIEVPDANTISVNGKKFKVISEKAPENLPWKTLGINVVIESTGLFTTRQEAEKHLVAGAKKVVLSAPCKGEEIPTIVLGVNESSLKKDDSVVSMASCTTNCLAPMAKIIEENFKVQKGYMTTVHAYTNDQRILDLPHKDLRRARAAALNIIPTTTGAAKALGAVLPSLKGKLDGLALRVPVPDGSITDFVVLVEKQTTIEEVNASFKKASETAMKGVLEFSIDPLVSSDIVGNLHSCVFDSLGTMVIQGNLVKVLGWYDNETGYSRRLLDLVLFMEKKNFLK